VLRFEADGTFDTWDKRWRNGSRKGLAADLTSPAVGSDLLPSLASADAIVQRITGLSGFRLNLGALTTDAHAEVTAGVAGLSLGLTRSVTIFGRLPLVRTRVQMDPDLDPTGSNAGANPGAAAHQTFLTDFSEALSILEFELENGTYDGDPQRRALAVQTLSDGNALLDDLFALLADPATASPFLPTATSDAGLAIGSRVAALQSTLDGSLGVPGFTAAPALPTGPATEEDFRSAVSDPAGPIGIQLGQSEVSFRGDAETGLAVTLADRWDRGRRRGGFRAAVEGLVRFPTGVPARLDRALAIGTGDGQTDLEVRGVVDLGTGNVGIRLEGGYNRQLAADLRERVAPPSQPLPPRSLETVVRLDPGDIIGLAARPFFRLARTFALIGGVEHWSKGRDAASYRSEADAIPGVDPDVLAEESDASATAVSVGVTYSNPGSLRPGGRGLPVDAGWTYERIVSASGGRLPDIHRVRARFRLYVGLW
jgi:hypothetical protein